MKLIYVLFVLMILGPGAIARNYYLDGKGDDGQDGSRGRPWKTLTAAGRIKLKPGDSLFLRGGQVFTGTLRIGPDAGGTALHPAWLGSYGEGMATIQAGDSSALVLYRVGHFVVGRLRLAGAGRKDGNVKDGLAIIDCHH